MDFSCSSVSKESACNAGDLGLIPGLGRSSGEGNGNPLQYSCLENPMDTGAWKDTTEFYKHTHSSIIIIIHMACVLSCFS